LFRRAKRKYDSYGLDNRSQVNAVVFLVVEVWDDLSYAAVSVIFAIPGIMVW
jgi:hypothetical protein